MTDLPVGDDGYLLMDQFSDADISESELGAEDWFTDPDPLPEAAWVRIVSGAVGEADDRPELDELVAAPAPADDLGADGFDDGDGAGPAHPEHPDDVPLHDPQLGAADFDPTDPGWPPPDEHGLPAPDLDPHHDTDS